MYCTPIWWSAAIGFLFLQRPPHSILYAFKYNLSIINFWELFIFQFLNLFGDVQSIKRAEDRHAKLFLPHRSMTELKKRHAEDFLTSDKVKVSRTYSVQSPAQSVIGAYPNAQNQWTNYGVQPQTWPPVTQAQGQQWTAGYTQQV